MQLDPATLSYGNEAFLTNVGDSGETTSRDVMPIPMTVFANSTRRATLMFMHAINDTTLAAAMDASLCA